MADPKPTPEMVGEGLAKKAAKEVQNRGKQIDKAVEEAEDGAHSSDQSSNTGPSGQSTDAYNKY